MRLLIFFIKLRRKMIWELGSYRNVVLEKELCASKNYQSIATDTLLANLPWTCNHARRWKKFGRGAFQNWPKEKISQRIFKSKMTFWNCNILLTRCCLLIRMYSFPPLNDKDRMLGFKRTDSQTELFGYHEQWSLWNPPALWKHTCIGTLRRLNRISPFWHEIWLCRSSGLL